jgi:SPP1 gp7 family putative phage head morphogenesis protein
MAVFRYKSLAPIRANREEFDEVEARILRVFREKIYTPLVHVVGAPPTILQNAEGDPAELMRALQSARIAFNRGTFSGKFNAKTSKALRSFGARWDPKTATFKLSTSELPQDIRSAVAASQTRFLDRLEKIDRHLASVSPEAVAEALNVSKLFDRTIYKMEDEFQANVRNISIQPVTTPEERRLIADEWQNNLRLYVKNFTEEQVDVLRARVKKSFEAGDRWGSLVGSVQDSFGVSTSKAKFLARQETKLLTAKYQQGRYADAGVNEYIWRTVVGSPAHPVRPSHKALAGTFQRFDKPPVTTGPDETPRRNNPGEDFGCRCWPEPIVRFK